MRTTHMFTPAMWFLALFAVLTLGACSDDNPATPTNEVSLGTGLLGHYTFEGDATDSSPAGNDGTLLGSATVSGVLTTGSNDTDALSLPATMVDGIKNFTFAGWVRMDTFHIWPSQWVSCATAAEDNNLGIWYDPNNNRWSMCFFNTSYYFGTNSVMEDTQWHHIVVTRSGGSASLYVDGDAVTTGLSVPSEAVAVDTGGFIIGQDQDSLGGGFATDNSLAGSVDHLRVYNRALSGAEAKKLFNVDTKPAG